MDGQWSVAPRSWRPWAGAPARHRVTYEGHLDDLPDWHALVVFCESDGRLVIEGIELHADDEYELGVGLTSTILAYVRLGELLNEAAAQKRDALDWLFEVGEVVVDDEPAQRAADFAPALYAARSSRGGRPRQHSDLFLASLAALYVKEVHQGRGARARVADYLGVPWTPELVRDRIDAARRRRLITAARPGSAEGRALTAAGERLVEGQGRARLRRNILREQEESG